MLCFPHSIMVIEHCTDVISTNTNERLLSIVLTKLMIDVNSCLKCLHLTSQKVALTHTQMINYQVSESYRWANTRSHHQETSAALRRQNR